MKKMMLLAVLFLTNIAYMKAQDLVVVSTTEKKASYWSLGPVGGFGHSWLMNINNQNFMPSGELGFGFIYSQDENWGAGADLTGSAEGYSTDYSAAGYNYDTEIMPIFLRLTPKVYYFFGDYGDMVRPKVYLGPSVGYKVTEEQRVSYTGYHNGDGPPAMVNPAGDVYKDFDFGVKAGVGANIRLASRTWFNFDGGYYQGLVDHTGNDNYNSNARLNIGVMFGL